MSSNKKTKKAKFKWEEREEENCKKVGLVERSF